MNDTLSRDARSVLEFHQQPHWILQMAGAVEYANIAAQKFVRRLGSADPAALPVADAGRLRAFLARCSGSSAPIPGTILLTGPDGPARHRVYGARFGGAGQPRVLLRMPPSSDLSEFALLSRKVNELNSQLHERRRIQASLEESLRENELLLRELHHRVKNNIQMMVGLFAAAQREASSPEVRAFTADAIKRLVAIGTAQQFMYRSDALKELDAREFLVALCEAIASSIAPWARVEVDVTVPSLGNEAAFPVSLILNELITNAFKYGVRKQDESVRVSLTRDKDLLVLAVCDSGPGLSLDHVERRASGLGLVKGLCRQLHGSFRIENDGGARVFISFEG